MQYIDLHVHTTASDGTLTPAEVVELAAKKHLAAISITDHDTVDGIAAGIAAAAEYNIEVIPGIELSCAYDKREIHILGYYINYTDSGLLSCLRELKEIRSNRNEQIAEKFREHGIPVSIEEMKQRYPDAILTRAHFASFIYEKGFAGSIKEVFDKYLHDNGPCFVARKKLEPKDTIALIHRTGGLAFLAHPVRYHMGRNELSKLVATLSSHGLDGIEAMYSTYTSSDESQMRILAKENHLILSGGSDFHGSNKPYIELGTAGKRLAFPYDILTGIKAKLESSPLQ